MATRTLRLVIDCGETTCASKPGHFCRFLGSRRFGQEPMCCLFPSKTESFTRLDDRTGWAKRLPECIAAEKAQVDE